MKNHCTITGKFFLTLFILFVGFLGALLANHFCLDLTGQCLYSGEVSYSEDGTKIIREVKENSYVEESAITNAVAKVDSSIVMIAGADKELTQGHVLEDQYEEIFSNNSKEEGLQRLSSGSGFIVSEDGIIVTSRHTVASREQNYFAMTSDGKKYRARVLARDELSDLALLQLSGILGEKPSNLNVVEFGNSTDLQKGQISFSSIYASGKYPHTLVKGMVANPEREITATNEFGENFAILPDMIQLDLDTPSGSSGAPVFNLAGQMIGMITSSATEGDYGFALASDEIKPVVSSYLSLNKIARPYIGARTETLDEELAETYGITVTYGARIMENQDGLASIMIDSPAEKAGLKPEDIILSIDGKEIRNNQTIEKILSDYIPGDKVTLKVLRRKEEISLDLTLEERVD